MISKLLGKSGTLLLTCFILAPKLAKKSDEDEKMQDAETDAENEDSYLERRIDIKPEEDLLYTIAKQDYPSQELDIEETSHRQVKPSCQIAATLFHDSFSHDRA
jgi:hypothetical protein